MPVIPAANMTNLSGEVSYTVDRNGTVKLNGSVMTLGAAGSGNIDIPVEAQPVADITPIYMDWSGTATDRNLILHSGGPFYIGYYNPVGSVINLSSVAWQGTPPPLPTRTLANVRTGISNAIKTIAGLRVYDFPSDRIEPPAAVLSLPETPYDVTLDGRSDEWTFPLWVLVAKADDKASYGEMVGYLEAEGPKSIRAVIEADRTLGGACDTAAVVKARPLFATVAGTEFLAVEFTLEVYT